jgi:hypothetical protein
MAKAAVSATRTAKRLRKGPTFIQRSRSVGSEQKAIWHNVTGAGASRVIREFFGASLDDQVAVKGGIETLLQARIERGSV